MSAVELWKNGEVSVPLAQFNLVVETSLCNVIFFQFLLDDNGENNMSLK